MGLVYKGRHENLDRCAALKALLPKDALDAAARQRLVHEARAHALLAHENIVSVYDFLLDDGELFIAMEYVDGETLTALLERSPNRRLPADAALPLILQVLAALAHVHAGKITHRDVKPSNVLVCNGNVKLTDFGIALVPDAPRLTAQQRLIGTIQYMSPEQLEGKDADSRSDIYSAALVLYAMLAGDPPFPSLDPLTALSQRMAGAPNLRRVVPDLAPGIWEAICTALQVDPEQRFPSADAFRDVLRDISVGFLQRRFDPEEDIPTEVHESIVEAEPLPAAPSHSIVPWLVLAATGVPAAGYVLINLLSHPPSATPASPPFEASVTHVTPVDPGPIPTATTETAVQTNTNDKTSSDTEPRFVTDASPEPAPVPDHEAEIARLRHEIASSLDRAEEDLRGERFDDAFQEIESAARSAQAYPDAFWRERDRIAVLRTRLIDARVAAEIRTQQDALWTQRITKIEESLSDRKWPEARRDAEEIVNDGQAPPAIADRARELLQQAKEGLLSAFQQTEVSGTINTTIRKPSSPPRKHE
jgi:serine/threonine protein kinase